MISGIAPSFEDMTGSPFARASARTNGNASYQTEGKTSAYASPMRFRISERFLNPRHSTEGFELANSFTIGARAPSPTRIKRIFERTDFHASSKHAIPFSGTRRPAKRI